MSYLHLELGWCCHPPDFIRAKTVFDLGTNAPLILGERKKDVPVFGRSICCSVRMFQRHQHYY